ncbi:MAG: GMC oxidoreductase, partial [Bacteroidota bacterium]
LTQAKNIDLYTYAQVVDIQANENVSNIESVTTKDHQGKTRTIKAKHFILACGAIQNTRLLLASNSQAPQGLGNDQDVVGRYFMEHLEIPSADLWLFQNFPTDLYTWKYGKTKASAELSLTAATQEKYQILNGTASLHKLSIARLMKPRMETWQNEDPMKSADETFSNWREARKQGAKVDKGIISRAFQLDTRIEQAPNPNSRVTLGQEKDALGVPQANLHWELTELDKKSIRMYYQILSQQMGQSGLGRIQFRDYLRDEKDPSWPEGTNAGWHHMGTTRMSDDPKKGVVNANCQVHGIQNLYVAGSACYPTAAAPNPTLTLTALSLRLSDYVKSKMQA